MPIILDQRVGLFKSLAAGNQTQNHISPSLHYPPPAIIKSYVKETRNIFFMDKMHWCIGVYRMPQTHIIRRYSVTLFTNVAIIFI